jgi:PAS domain S-box-containing protein
VALPLVLSVFCLVVLLQVYRDARRQVADEELGARLGSLTARLELSYYQAVTSATKYHSSRSEKSLAKLKKAIEAIEKQERQLEKLLDKRAEIKPAMDQTKADGKQALAFLHEIADGASSNFGGDIHPRIFQSKGQKLIEHMVEDVAKLSDYAKKCEMAANANGSQEWVEPAIFISILANVFIASVLAVYLYRDIGQRLALVRRNAMALATGQELEPPLEPGDEIAELDSSIHSSAVAIAEAKRKENALIDNALDVLCSIDNQMKFVRVSSAASKVWGYDPTDLEGMRIVQLLAKESNEETLKSIEKIIANASEGSLDTKLVRSDARVIDVYISAYWSKQDRALFCVVRDVTREREFERIKQKLMDTVAHDLRSPIASIRVVLDSLAMGLLGPQNEKAVARIEKAEKSADRLLRLINDLLDYDKFESGQFTLDLQQCSLADIIDGAVVAIEGLTDERKLKVSLTGEDIAVTADADRMTQVVVNLLSNAVKFSPEGSTVTINSAVEEEYAIVEIIDQGPGIPDHMKSQIFERFKQVEETAKTHKGTGLGLPIAKQIVEAHKGEIGVRDAEGGGTVFWFTILRVLTVLIVSVYVINAAIPVSAQSSTARNAATTHQPGNETVQARERTVTFPAKGKYSAGSVMLVPVDADGRALLDKGRLLGQARGTFQVPAGHGLYLIVTPEGVNALPEIASGLKPGDLFRLRIHNTSTPEKTFTAIGTMKGLVELDVGSTDASDASIQSISKLTDLKSLDVSKTMIAGKTFAGLKTLTRLQLLDLSNNRLAPNTIKELARALPNLDDIDVGDNRLVDEDVAEICAYMKSLKRLDISQNSKITDRSVDAICSLKKLRKIDLRDTAVSQQGVIRIRAKLPHCKLKI